MFEQQPRITSREHEGSGYLEIYWSPLTQGDKYSITTSVPSVSGIYELYYRSVDTTLNLLSVNCGWYGGLRSQLRQDVEPAAHKAPNLRVVLEHAPLYYRFAQCSVLADIEDALWFLHTVYFGDKTVIKPSGRYEHIFVKEFAPDQIRWI